jgi:uncharacterized protein YdeI (YjbR/CyaY-like superfamily)
MPTTDPRIDKYIDKSADYAKPILRHLRELVHRACPQVSETMKWSFPHFEYKGILCSMAAYKKHCSFGFWKAALMDDSEQYLNRIGNTGMGHFDRITNLNDLPKDKVMIAYIKEAVKLNENDIKLPPRPKSSVKEMPIPKELAAAFKKNKKAATNFENFPPSHRKDYIQWVAEAKTDTTRSKRIETAIEWISEGKGRNWKYDR